MEKLPNCPECDSDLAYNDGVNLVCPMCGHEWKSDDSSAEEVFVWKDSFGTELEDGDSVTVIKDLKIKGSSSVVKRGTKVKNIRFIEGDHDIDCKIPGIGPMQLKSEFVKKTK